MTKKLAHDLTYDAPADAVAAMLADPAFREEVCDYQRVLRRSVTIERTGSGMEVVVDQVQEARGLPSFATKFVGDEINIVQRETWTSMDGADIHVVIPGKPGEMKGTGTLVEAGGGTTHEVRFDIRVAIPLVGAKIEGLVSDMLLKALKAENKVGRDYLSR
jgi:predicted HTH transcriptional regulator